MPQKYLHPDEKIVHQTDFLTIGREEGFKGYLTNKRLLLLKREGFLVKKDKLIDVRLNTIGGCKVEDKGFLIKRKTLYLDTAGGKVKVSGFAADVHELHKQINEQLFE